MVASATLISRKMIKPSSPTPSSLRRLNLSLIDHIVTPAFAPIAIFYSKPAAATISQISVTLENSLSEVLASYYPIAGTLIKDSNRLYVDCNDTGAEYLIVQISCPMSEILDHAYNDAIDLVFPQDLPWSCSLNGTRPLLVVQLSHFDCGGIAVSVCMSHKVVDGYSISKFLTDWGAIARQCDFKPSPQFDIADSFFPLTDDAPAGHVVCDPQPCVSRMYHFSSSSLGRLKNIVAMNSEVKDPTRVEVATALLHKCSRANNPGLLQPSLSCLPINLRPPVPLNSIGNTCLCFYTVATTEDEVRLPNFVAQLRKAKQHLKELKDRMSPNELTSYTLQAAKNVENVSLRDMFDYYIFSSLCNLGLCSVDFGWGTPTRVTVPTNSMKNFFIFLDDPSGDGMDVVITLTEADMCIFESNKELLQFASPVSDRISST